MFQMIVQMSLKCFSVNFFSAIINGIKTLTVAASQKSLYLCSWSPASWFWTAAGCPADEAVLHQVQESCCSWKQIYYHKLQSMTAELESMMLSMVEREMLWRGS